MKTGNSFFGELQRRRVLPVAGAWIAVAWLVTEIAGFVLDQAGAPGWALRLLAIVFVVGFPMAVVLAWVVQKQPDGRWEIDSSRGQRHVVVTAITLGVVATAALSWLILPRIGDTPGEAAYQPLPNSLAILPLATPGGTPNERTVAETLYDALLAGLDHSHELTQVRLKVAERPPDLAAFGREFRVGALLVGQVFRSAGATRVEMQLLDVGQDEMYWSHTMNWDPTRIMDISAEIGNRALEAMDLPVIEKTRFSGTDSEEAYEAWLKAGRHHLKFTVIDMALAMQEYQRAIDADPGFVRAYTGLAALTATYGLVAGLTEDEHEAMKEQARQLVQRALEIDDESPWAISALARFTDNRELKVQLYERALELEPDHLVTLHRYALDVFRDNGEFEQAAKLLGRALQLDPLDANNHVELAKTLYGMGRNDEAIAQYRKAIEIEPDAVEAYFFLGNLLMIHAGLFDEALVLFRKGYSLISEAAWAPLHPANAYAALGMEKEALAWLEKGLQIDSAQWPMQELAAAVHFRLGHADDAMKYVRMLPAEALRRPRGGPWWLAGLGSADIEAGSTEQALQRWERIQPEIAGSDDPPLDSGNVWFAAFYAKNLLQAGETDRARRLLRRCDELTDSATIHVLLGERDEALAALHREIVTEGRFSERLLPFYDPAYDFLRDDPEFQELERTVRERLAQQRQRVEDMERNGELAAIRGTNPDDM